ncbi:unnamed protein product, partial [marine sediment metagenome]
LSAESVISWFWHDEFKTISHSQKFFQRFLNEFINYPFK